MGRRDCGDYAVALAGERGQARQNDPVLRGHLAKDKVGVSSCGEWCDVITGRVTTQTRHLRTDQQYKSGNYNQTFKIGSHTAKKSLLGWGQSFRQRQKYATRDHMRIMMRAILGLLVRRCSRG
jgi:hypothetical protein